MKKGRLTMGSFELTRERLGKGRQGTVYLGYHRETREKVAIKVIKVSKETSEKDLQEVRELRRLQVHMHPHVVRLIDQHRSDTHVAMILEYCEGGNLQDYLEDNGQLNEEEAQYIFAQILCGVHFLHEQRLLHRDLKPENILLTSSDIREAVVRIADLGFAKSKPLQENPLFQSMQGTPMYMAPERIEHRAYNFSSEVWAAGVILYRMLFRMVPFGEARTKAELAEMQRKPIVIPTTVPISQECKDILTSMLQIDPTKRPSIAELREHPWLAQRTVAVATSRATTVPPFMAPIPPPSTPSPPEREVMATSLTAEDGARLVTFCADTFAEFRFSHRAALYAYAASLVEKGEFRQKLIRGARCLLRAAQEVCTPSPRDLLLSYATRTCREIALDEDFGYPPTNEMMMSYARCEGVVALIINDPQLSPSHVASLKALAGMIHHRVQQEEISILDFVRSYMPSAPGFV